MKKTIINLFLTVVVLLYILFEELIWERFAEPIVRYIQDLRILRKLQKLIVKIDSRVILVIFVLLFVSVEMLGVYAGAMFLQGSFIVGVFLYGLKIPIAAFTFWLFNVSKKKLLQFEWFRQSYYYITAIMDKITHSQIYITTKERARKVKLVLKQKFLSDKSIWKERVVRIYRRLKAVLRS